MLFLGRYIKETQKNMKTTSDSCTVIKDEGRQF